MPYSFNIVHIPGKQNCGPDATSRYPTKTATIHDSDDNTHEEITKCAAMFARTQSESLPDALTWEEINEAALIDEECATLKRVIEHGFPERRGDLPTNLRYYWSMRKDLYVINNVSFKGKKMLIPKVLRARVLDGLHAAHQGVNSMHLHAKEQLFWPGLSADISQKRGQCKTCNENAPSQPDEPLIITPEPTSPFEQVASDIYQIGRYYYHIYADRLSGWTEVAKIKSTAFKHLKKDFQRWFQTFGIPNEISSDGGPPYNSHEYDQFLKKWGISKRLSSAHYPQSNGRAEVAVKAMKRTLDGNVNPLTGDIDTDEATKAIMTHRNTPSQERGISPSEALFGYRIRDHLPDGSRQIKQRAKLGRSNTKKIKKLKTGKPLPPLKLGDCVRIQNQIGNCPKKWNNIGKIIEVKPYRQYLVQPNGSRRATLRNRKFLKKTIEPLSNIPSKSILTQWSSSRHQNDKLDNKPADNDTPNPAITKQTDNYGQQIIAVVSEPTENITDIDIDADAGKALVDQAPTDQDIASNILQGEETPQILTTPQISSTPQSPKVETQYSHAIDEVRRSKRHKSMPKRLIEEI